jgi:hypothetical protein
MSEKELNALPEEEAKLLPFLDLWEVSSEKSAKGANAGERRANARAYATWMLGWALHPLGYLRSTPSSSETPELVSAVKSFQARIGAKPTGTLLFGEFESLMKALDLMYPKKIYLPDASVLGAGDYVRARGTWVFEGDEQATPLSTSDIRCIKDEGVCEHVQAALLEGAHLDLYREEFSITKWTADEVVAENDAPTCVAYTLTINLRKKEAHEFRRPRGGKECEQFEVSGPRILRLVDGGPVGRDYYSKRETAARKYMDPEFIANWEAVMKRLK